LPTYIPDLLSGKTSPNEKITIGCIGTGRMGRGDLTDILDHDDIQVVAVCDVDDWRLQNAKKQVENHYQLKQTKGRYSGCKIFQDYRDLIVQSDIDAVMICTADHWHALPAIEAARKGKDIFLQKPLTLTIPEGRVLSNTVRKYHRILQVGSQQRSDTRFRFAAELVRNGRIGKLQTVRVGFGKDPFTGIHPVKPIPKDLNYDFWLGPTPYVDYVEERVHPQKAFSRPGWLRTDAYCCGMITGWGSHHLDSAHWGMDTEYTGPIEIDGHAEYSKGGTWDVHGAFRIEYSYKNGVKMIVTDNAVNKQGIVFEGSKGWVYVRRGYIDADPKWLLKEKFGPGEISLYKSNNHKRNWIDCMKTRTEPAAPVEIGHRSGSACILGYISMKLDRKIYWNPSTEKFIDDKAANRLLWREYRGPWKI
jgi:predicted dehydrogenase